LLRVADATSWNDNSEVWGRVESAGSKEPPASLDDTRDAS
jgi:hypothetical protein